jgi:hypothetical protein
LSPERSFHKDFGKPRHETVACPPLERFVFAFHARFEMERRSVSESEVSSVLRAPEQTEEQRPGRCIYQKRVPGPSEDTVYLLRVFVDVDRDPAEVVSAYRTSKVGKYWRLHASDL